MKTVMLVCTPALNSRLRYWASDEDGARGAAQERLDASLEQLRALGIDASGEVGDADPLQAMEDALRTFGADEIIISTHPEGRSNWLERGVVEHARERFAVPITHVVVDLDREREEAAPDGSPRHTAARSGLRPRPSPPRRSSTAARWRPGQRDEDHDERDRVHDRQVLALADESEDQQRERVLRPGGEERDDDLVERERECEQGAGEERRADTPAGSRSGTSGSRSRRDRPRPRRTSPTSAAAGRARCCRRHDTEGRMPDHDRPEREAPCSRRRRTSSAPCPVMIPGSAIGSTKRNEIALWPKNAKRVSAEGGERAEHERDRRSPRAPP